MNKENFMTILHEGETMDEMVLDELKGGDCGFCPCNQGVNNNGPCGTFG